MSKSTVKIHGDYDGKWVRDSPFISASDVVVGDKFTLTVKSVNQADFPSAHSPMKDVSGVIMTFKETEKYIVMATEKDSKMIGSSKAKDIMRLIGTNKLSECIGRKVSFEGQKMKRKFGKFNHRLAITAVK